MGRWTTRLSNWAALSVYPDDGWLDIDNNEGENSVRGLALGRKNWLFLGSDRGGRAAAIHFSLLASCKRHGHDPWVYLPRRAHPPAGDASRDQRRRPSRPPPPPLAPYLIFPASSDPHPAGDFFPRIPPDAYELRRQLAHYRHSRPLRCHEAAPRRGFHSGHVRSITFLVTPTNCRPW